jgi:hypothetical protein
MIPAVDSTVTLTFKYEGAPSTLFKVPPAIDITGKVVATPHWVKDPACFALFVAGTPVPLRIINSKDVIAINGAKAKAKPEVKVETYTVKGSKGDEYTVTNEAGRWACTCVGFGFRKDCKHIQGVRK